MLRARVIEHGKLWIKQEGAPLTVVEGWANAVPPGVFRRLRVYDERREARGEQRLFDWGYSDYAKARDIVGVVTLPGLQLEVLPKITMRGAEDDVPTGDKKPLDPRVNFVLMLRHCGLYAMSGLDVARVGAGAAPLADAMVRGFAQNLGTELQRGMSSDYVERELNRPSVRGRILHAKDARLNLARRDRVFCRFASFEIDHRLHRLFKATCRFLLRLTPTPETEARLKLVLGLLDEVTDVPLTPELAEAIPMDRRVARFVVALDFCRLVVEGLAPEATSGDWQSFSLLFDMDKVFEGFIAGFMGSEVVRRFLGTRPGTFVLTTQGKSEGKHLLVRDGSGHRLLMKPDIIVRYTPRDSEPGDTKTVVIDTKWKLAFKDKRWVVANSDLYQVYAYAREFDAVTTVLLYPHTEGLGRQNFVLNDSTPATGGTGPRKVWIRTVSMSWDLKSDEGRDGLRLELLNLLEEAFGLPQTQTLNAPLLEAPQHA